MTMRAFIDKLVIVSLLFVSLEGATEVIEDVVPAGYNTGHPHELGHTVDIDNTEIDTEFDCEQCKHCCHVHSSSLSPQVSTITMTFVRIDLRIGRSAHVRNFAQAPPTPPPTI